MGMEIDQMRDELRSIVGMDDTDLPDDKTDLFLNRSYWEIIDKFHFREKEVTVTFSTIAGTRLYNMPSPFEALRQLSITDPNTNKHQRIDRETIDTYEAEYDPDEEEQGLPLFYVREGCAVRLRPTPDAEYEITQKYWTTLSDLSDTNTAPNIPQSWHEIILYGAAWRTYISIGDFVRANECKKHQKSLIDSAVPVEAKEEYDSHRSGLAPQIREYDV